MKNFLKKWMQIGACSLLPLAGMAQDGQAMRGTPETRAQRSVQALTEKVQVTPQQKQALQGTFTNYFRGMQERLDNKDRKGVKELGEKRDTEVMNILKDKDKYAAYQAFMEEKKLRMKNAGAMRKEGNTASPAAE